MESRNSQLADARVSADYILCMKYYGEVLGICAMDSHYKNDSLSWDCDPESYSKIIGRDTFTPAEYLAYLGEQGFNTQVIQAGVSRLQDLVRGSNDKAEKLFKIFKEEWMIDQSSLKMYLDNVSIYHFLELVVANAASTKARLKAIKRHAEHHAMKADVFTWLDSQPKFKSIESAATAITRQQPIAHVTARDWYKEWKKLRSASTP